MLRQTKGLLIVVIAVGVVMGWGPSAMAWDVQQKYRNDTDETAYDLMKIIEGEVTITDAIHDEFAQWDTWHSAGDTYLKFYDGDVAPGEDTWACFDVEGDGTDVNVKGAYWTDSEGQYIDDAGEPVGGSYSQEFDWDSFAWNVTIDVRNRLDSDFTGQGTVVGSQVFWAFVPTRFPLDELTEALWAPGSGITWNAEAGFSLGYDQTSSYSVPDAPPDHWIIFRFLSERSGGTSVTPVVELWQMPTGTTVPTVSEWGLIIMTLLLLTAGTLVFARRRRPVAT